MNLPKLCKLTLSGVGALTLSCGLAHAGIDMSGFSKMPGNIPSSYWSQWPATHNAGLDRDTFLMLYVWPDIINSSSGFYASAITSMHINTVWYPTANSSTTDMRDAGLLAISSGEEWVDGTSSSAVAVAEPGSKVQFAVIGGNKLDWHPGDKFLIYSRAGYTQTASTNWMKGTFVSYSGGTNGMLTINVTANAGSGSHSDWTILLLRYPNTGNTGFGRETIAWDTGAEPLRILGIGNDLWSEHLSTRFDGSSVEPGYQTCLGSTGCVWDAMTKLENRFPDKVHPRSTTVDQPFFSYAWAGQSDSTRAGNVNGNGSGWPGTHFFTYDEYVYTVGYRCASNDLGQFRSGSGPEDGLDSKHHGASRGHGLTHSECHRAWNYGLYTKEAKRLDGLDGIYQPIIGQVEAVSAEYDGTTRTRRITGPMLVGAVAAQFIEGVNGMGYFQHSDICDPGRQTYLSLRDPPSSGVCHTDAYQIRPYIKAINAYLLSKARMINSGRFNINLSQAELSYATWQDPVDNSAHVWAIQKNDHDSGTYQLTLPGTLCAASKVTITLLQDGSTKPGAIDGSCHLSIALAHEYDAVDIKLEGSPGG